MSYKNIINLLSSGIEQYNWKKETVDSFITRFIANQNQLANHAEIQLSVSQMLYEIFRYKDFLSCFIKMFQSNHNQYKKEDKNIYMSICYLICFKMKDIKFDIIKQMANALPKLKVSIFLQFLFDRQLILKSVIPLTNQYLQQDYVKKHILPQLEYAQIYFKNFLNTISIQSFEKPSRTFSPMPQNLLSSNQEKKIKKVQEFELSRSNAISQMTEPITLSTSFKAKPMPKSKININQIQRRNEERLKQKKREVLLKYKNEPRNGSLHQSQIKKIVRQQQSKQVFPKIKHYNRSPTDVSYKINIAAILKEDKLLQSQNQNENKKINELVTNLRNTNEFVLYKNKILEKQREEQRLKSLLKKYEISNSIELINKATEQKRKQNELKVKQLKKQLLEIKINSQNNKLKQKEYLLNVKKNIQNTHKNVRLEKFKLIQRNKQFHDQIIEDNIRIKQQKNKQDQIQMEKRKQIINMIKQLDKNVRNSSQNVSISPSKRNNSYSTLQTVELKELLKKKKSQMKKIVQDRRKQLMKQREQHNQSIKSKKEKLQNHHSLMNLKIQQQRDNLILLKREQLMKQQQQKKKSLQKYRQKMQLLQKQKQKIKEMQKRKQKQTQMQKRFNTIMNLEQSRLRNLESAQEKTIQNNKLNKLIKQLNNQKIEIIRMGQYKSLHQHRNVIKNELIL